MGQLIDFLLHLDDYLKLIIEQYGTLTYLILFAIVFAETGLVVTPFLPGDSLLFAAGAFAALGSFNIWVLIVLLSLAAIIGDTVNYSMGKWIGPRAFDGRLPLIKREHLERTQAFFAKYGGKTIILARFIPIVRTFAPFVAGVGSMAYGQFVFFNVVGGIFWVTTFTLLGYFFGNLEFIKKNFELVVVVIIVISVVPALYEWWKARKN